MMRVDVSSLCGHVARLFYNYTVLGVVDRCGDGGGAVGTGLVGRVRFALD